MHISYSRYLKQSLVAGPVGLLSAIMANRLGMKVAIFDKKSGPIEKGRADALNARSIQFLEILDLLEPLWQKGKQCNSECVDRIDLNLIN